jgi:histone acetyltransferase
MKLLYPASAEIPSLTDSQLALKVARHLPCSTCDSCTGLRPPAEIEVVLNEAKVESPLGNLEQYGSDDDYVVTNYLDTCVCGHGVEEHGADVSEIGTEEFKRRGRVAVRLDEILHVRHEICMVLIINYFY